MENKYSRFSSNSEANTSNHEALRTHEASKKSCTENQKKYEFLQIKIKV